MKVPPEKTPVTELDMIDAITTAWRAEFPNTTPTRESVALLVAHWAHETGSGRSMMNFNVGNMKADARYTGDFTYFRTWEVMRKDDALAVTRARPTTAKLAGSSPDGTTFRVDFMPEDPACCFRAYPTLAAGCRDYLRRMVFRFNRAWSHVLAGKVVDFTIALKAQGYFTASLASYQAAMLGHYHRVLGLTDPDMMPVQQAQSALIQLGFQPGPVDGQLGPRTSSALSAFQIQEALPVTGTLSKDTVARIRYRLGMLGRP